jgi:glycosyltransferase involved in cell wall biosynthesis
MKVSVIVPVYNTEGYLAQCLESLLKQTLQEIEIICVDNGSTDASLEILRRTESIHANVTVLVHVEGKQGAARNAGMKIAQGDYIGFVDSDDFVEPEMFEKMVAKASLSDAEIAICNIRLFFQDDNAGRTHLPEDWFVEEAFHIKSRKVFFRNLTICNKLFKRSFLEDSNIIFPEEYFHEDQVFVVQAYTKATKMVGLSEPYYQYRKQRLGSVSSLGGESASDIFSVMKTLSLYFDELGDDDYDLLFSELVISRYIQLIGSWQRKAYFEEMKRQLPKLPLEFEPEILVRSEIRTYRSILKHSYVSFMLVFFVRSLGRKFISYDLIGTPYFWIKERL